ncbi:MAG: sn-glycerol-1-phosphate dehydrogenase [Kiritimatiellia bacterium]
MNKKQVKFSSPASRKAEELLGAEFDCECGRRHRLDLHKIVYSENAIAELPEVLAQFTTNGDLAVVCDERTFRAAGERVLHKLEEWGGRTQPCLVPDPPCERPRCDEATFGTLRQLLPPNCTAIVAVGSGVITDLCKWLATDMKIPYVVVPTAASMNGYASANIAPTIAGVKRILRGTVPYAICAVPSVLRNAPYELTAAGLGDVLAKPVSITDWRINHLIFGEYCCEFCCRLIREFESNYLDYPDRLRNREAEAVQNLFYALVFSGVAMTLADTSFPASGGEHLISHVLDMTAALHRVAHDYHGRQVGIGTIFAAALYERLITLESPVFRDVSAPTDAAYWGPLTPVVEEEHGPKRRRAALALQRLRHPGVWDQVRSIACANSLPAARIKECLRCAGAAHRLSDIGCTMERFLAAVQHSHEIRERYTVIDLARATGILPGAAPEIVTEYLLT